MSEPAPSDNDYELEAKTIAIFEVKENVPAKEAGKKPSTRSLGFARTADHAKVILDNLPHGGKAVEKEALLIRPKGGNEDEAEMVVKSKTIHCIFHIDNHSKLPLEQYHAFSKDQQRYLSLISESAIEELDAE